MKVYIYRTATGDIDIELDDTWHEWLSDSDRDEENSNRRHTRADHKYAPGKPVSLDHLTDDIIWLAVRSSESDSADLSVDFKAALQSLTELQRRYFILTHIIGYTCAEIARLERKHKTTISDIVISAQKKIEKFLY